MKKNFTEWRKSVKVRNIYIAVVTTSHTQLRVYMYNLTIVPTAGITEEYETTHSKRLRIVNTSLHDLQAELDSLVDQSVSLQHSLKDSQEKIEHCKQVVTCYPDQIKTLKEKITDKNSIIKNL